MVLVAGAQQKSVTVYEGRDRIRILDIAATIDGGPVVPGWSLPVLAIFG